MKCFLKGERSEPRRDKRSVQRRSPRRRAGRAAIITLLVVILLPMAALAQVYVIADELNGRAAASMHADVESHFYFGDALDVVDSSSDWIEVKGGETGTVFVLGIYTSADQPVEAEHTSYQVVANGKVHVRATPGGEAKSRIDPGKTVTVSHFCGGWARTKGGWIKTEYLEVFFDAER